MTVFAAAITKAESADRHSASKAADVTNSFWRSACNIHHTVSDQLVTLRRTFDERLIALETGLANPDHGPSIESLILDLARVAAEEAEAAARDSIRRIRREAAEQTAASAADAEETQALLEAERSRTETLRAEIATLTEQLSNAKSTRQKADSGKQREIEQLNATVKQLNATVEEMRMALDE